jgi:hypothetical protein
VISYPGNIVGTGCFSAADMNVRMTGQVMLRGQYRSVHLSTADRAPVQKCSQSKWTHSLKSGIQQESSVRALRIAVEVSADFKLVQCAH